MNWVKRLFSQPDKAVDKDQDGCNAGNEKQTAVQAPLSLSEPVSVNVDPQALSVLKKFVPLRDLDDHCILQIPHKLTNFITGSVLFIRNQPADAVVYLLQGEVEMQPDSSNSYTVTADSTQANLPLNSGKVYGATAVAKSDVQLLDVSGDLTQLWLNKSQQQVSCIELVDLQLPEQISDNLFFNSFAQSYRENKLSLPSLPHVALKLKDAMQQDIGVAEAVDIIQVDPPIATKLIQVANSPLYSPVSPISNCQDAVARLGLAATRNLVIGISLKQLFTSKDARLMKRMQQLWRDSLYISSLSFILAQESGAVNPEDALLAGLISDIGIIPLFHFAEQYPDQYPDVKQFQAAIPYLRAPVGTLVLHTLGFSEELTQIPHYAEDWYYDSGAQLNLTDIVIVAKLHSYYGNRQTTGLPHINAIPAYHKLPQGQLNPDFSLYVLHKAQQRIQAAMRILT